MNDHQVNPTPKFSDNPVFENAHFEEPNAADFGMAPFWDVAKIYESFSRFEVGGSNRDIEFIREHYDIAVEVVSTIFNGHLDGRVLDIHEIVDQVDPNKSAGYGYRHANKGLNIRDHYENFSELCEEPEWTFDIVPIWTVAGKEEIRAKVKDPRTFQFPPQLYHMQVMRYTKYANLKLQSDWRATPSKVGMSLPDDWPEFVTALISKKPDVIPTWDGKTFDASQACEFRWMCKDIRLKCWNGDGADEADYYLEHLYYWAGHSVCMMPDGLLVLVNQGMKSGDPNTTVDNTITHVVMLFYCWIRCGMNPWKFPAFVRRVKFGLFGDDGIASYVNSDEEAACFFRHMAENWERTFGVPLKLSLNKDMTEATFLGKRSLSVHGDGLLTPCVSDTGKLVASMLEKCAIGSGQLEKLQQLVAYRSLLAPFVYSEDPRCRSLLTEFDRCVIPWVKEEASKYDWLYRLPEFQSCYDRLIHDVREIAWTPKFAKGDKEHY